MNPDDRSCGQGPPRAKLGENHREFNGVASHIESLVASLATKSQTGRVKSAFSLGFLPSSTAHLMNAVSPRGGLRPV